MKGLKAYKLDKAFTDGVVIRLEDAPDVAFLVRLPSGYNRAYTQAVYGGMRFDLDDEGNVKPGGSLLETKYAQEDAFMEHCLVSIDGEPVPDNFAVDYPRALQELMSKAQELANALDEQVDDAVKKSPATSNGSTDGEVKKSSMQHLQSAAS